MPKLFLVPTETCILNGYGYIQGRSGSSERANLAQERRDQLKLKEKQKALHLQTIHKKNEKRLLKNKQSRLSYWLLSASLKEIIQLLFLGKTKSI